MGMDVLGTAPASLRSRYFGRNLTGWHPLANYCTTVWPKLSAGCGHWHSNDGDGLDAKTARELATALRHDIETGLATDLIEDRYCQIHGGAKVYTLDVTTLEEFADFLEDCGGFEIR